MSTPADSHSRSSAAAAMRPDETHYTEALRSVRATLQARTDQGASKTKDGSE